MDWQGQGYGDQTWTQRAKSMIEREKKEKKPSTAWNNNDNTEQWQNYVPQDWEEADDAWGNPARGNAPTPGASSSSDIAWYRYPRS